MSEWPLAPGSDELRAHEEWRPDWTIGRSCLYWYLTFDGAHDLTRVWLEAEPMLAPLATVDMVPREWLHLTVLEVGFVDEVQAAELESILAAARDFAAGLPPIEVELGQVTTMTDSVVLAASCAPLAAIRAGLIDAGATGQRQGNDDAPFRPHVTLGYLNSGTRNRAIMDSFGTPASQPVRLPVADLMLAAVTRLRSHYRWEEVATLRLGADPDGVADE
ncbi:MAG TPA: 2'-5' RNA ligase family protein [Nocardioides sp.]|jgi:2'-5' RNA ligase